eukprot:360766-Chlamydomonas_euryale.AAC.17
MQADACMRPLYAQHHSSARRDASCACGDVHAHPVCAALVHVAHTPSIRVVNMPLVCPDSHYRAALLRRRLLHTQPACLAKEDPHRHDTSGASSCSSRSNSSSSSTSRSGGSGSSSDSWGSGDRWGSSSTCDFSSSRLAVAHASPAAPSGPLRSVAGVVRHGQPAAHGAVAPSMPAVVPTASLLRGLVVPAAAALPRLPLAALQRTYAADAGAAKRKGRRSYTRLFACRNDRFRSAFEQIWPTLRLTEAEAQLFRRNSRLFVVETGRAISLKQKFNLARPERAPGAAMDALTPPLKPHYAQVGWAVQALARVAGPSASVPVKPAPGRHHLPHTHAFPL